MSLEELWNQAAARFRAWREANDLGAESEPQAYYANMLNRIHEGSGLNIDWEKFVTSPDQAFLADMSGFIRHVNPDGSLRRNYHPSCES